MIPKIIHHIWVGDSPIPNRFLEYISSAKKLHSEYIFKFWNESNSVMASPFVQYWYKKKKWAFVSDYLRFQILYEYGGVYLDADMELLKNIDLFMEGDGFSGLNRQRNSIYCGIVGAQPKHHLIKRIIDAYDNLPEGEILTSPEIFTREFLATSRYAFDIYGPDVFYPCEEGEEICKEKLINAFATHHWNESWRSCVPLRRFMRRVGAMKFYHYLFHSYGEELNIRVKEISR